MGNFTFIVFTEPRAGQDREYNDWYDRRHLADTLAVDGIVSARRYRLAPTAKPQPALPTYLTIYEIVADDVDEVTRAISAAVDSGAMPISPSLDPGSTLAAFYQPLAAP